MSQELGDESVVNTTTTKDQVNPSIAALSGGGYVIVWRDESGPNYDIRGQVFDADGNKLGNEIPVNTITESNQLNAEVAALTDGGFVVTWSDESRSVDDDDFGAVRAQRFDADGDPVGDEFLVNTQTDDDQVYPGIAGLTNGGFVITWTTGSGDADGKAIHGQRFDSDGDPVGIEFQVNSTEAGDQTDSAVAALKDGGFVVVWKDDDTDPGSNIRGQRFDAAGDEVGEEVLINGAAGYHSHAQIAALANGGLVVVWQESEDDSIFGQRFNPDGSKAGGRVSDSGRHPRYPARANRVGFGERWLRCFLALR